MAETDKQQVEDAIINAEREVAALTTDSSRLKRLMQVVVDVSQKVGISAAGSTLGRLVQLIAGLG
ncbi:hypothetical protein [Devosia ginsengisoli]|uniref:hypothetical protein n=1 Tax=Devosia ginsengisoli TaxID=400770 RepID=UPI0026F1883C|nr:hypothetical protein [Devosia ginsengisoli]MCR6670727.1 hypothetical protein [Devosia ginsengisoli]